MSKKTFTYTYTKYKHLYIVGGKTHVLSRMHSFCSRSIHGLAGSQHADAIFLDQRSNHRAARDDGLLVSKSRGDGGSSAKGILMGFHGDE